MLLSSGSSDVEAAACALILRGLLRWRGQRDLAAPGTEGENVLAGRGGS